MQFCSCWPLNWIPFYKLWFMDRSWNQKQTRFLQKRNVWHPCHWKWSGATKMQSGFPVANLYKMVFISPGCPLQKLAVMQGRRALEAKTLSSHLLKSVASSWRERKWFWYCKISKLAFWSTNNHRPDWFQGYLRSAQLNLSTFIVCATNWNQMVAYSKTFSSIGIKQIKVSP